MRGIILLAAILISCNESPIVTKHNVNVDSILQQNKLNFTVVNNANRKSDTAISTKVTKTAEKIIKMEGEITQLKAENNELKDKLNDATDNGKPYSGLPVSND